MKHTRKIRILRPFEFWTSVIFAILGIILLSGIVLGTVITSLSGTLEQAIPALVVLGVVTVLTLPAGLRGLLQTISPFWEVVDEYTEDKNHE